LQEVACDQKLSLLQSSTKTTGRVAARLEIVLVDCDNTCTDHVERIRERKKPFIEMMTLPDAQVAQRLACTPYLGAEICLPLIAQASQARTPPGRLAAWPPGRPAALPPCRLVTCLAGCPSPLGPASVLMPCLRAALSSPLLPASFTLRVQASLCAAAW